MIIVTGSITVRTASGAFVRAVNDLSASPATIEIYDAHPWTREPSRSCGHVGGV